MRLRTILIMILSGWCATASAADITPRLDELVSQGNRAYEDSRRSIIKQSADSLASLLKSAELASDAAKDYAVALNKLYGNYFYECAMLDSAEIYYANARRIIDENPNTDFHGNDLLMLREEAQLLYRQARYSEAVQTMTRVDDLLEYGGRYLPGDDNWLVTKLSYAMCLARAGMIDDALSMAETEIANANDKNSLTYARALRMLGKIKLLANADRMGALRAYKQYFKSQKSHALTNFARLDAAAREEYWQTLRPFISDCYLLEDEDPAFLYDVTLFAKGLLLQLSAGLSPDDTPGSALKALGYDWTDIQRRLRPGHAAIEFVEYERDGKSRMAAIIVRSTGKPRYVRLTDPSTVLDLAGADINATSRDGKDRLYADEKVQNAVWIPELLSALSGVTTLYFAPDGYLHRLAIEYMPQVEHMNIHRLTSTRRLMDNDGSTNARGPMLLAGGINYDLDKVCGHIDGNDAEAYSHYIGKRFPRLSDSTNEAARIFDMRHCSNDSLISGSGASEYEFRRLAPLFRSILVSTHGDFCGEIAAATDLKPATGNEAMSKNIIALSGVNSYLRDSRFNPASGADGLLSAREIATLNLGRCSLFTMSACQTALGQISADGVFGLQRGLKNAGVGAMLLSLWNVNSEATALFMSRFYANISTGMGVHAAFSQARRSLLENAESDSLGDQTPTMIFNPATMAYEVSTAPRQDFSSPQFTNAFILIDAL